MIDAVRVADERVGHRAQVQQAIPIGVIPCQARDLKPQDDANVRERYFGSHACEAIALMRCRAREAEIVVDDDDPVGGPAQLLGAFFERVLSSGGLAILLDLPGR